MNKREFTPEEIAKSLEVCFGTCCGCGGCIYCGCGGCIYEVEPDLSSLEVDCRTDLVNIAAGTIKAQAERIGELEAELAKLREENRWIPVEERLPGMDDGPFHTDGELSAVSVLAVIEGAEWATTLYFDVDSHDFFDMQGDELIPYRVTRWKPMPKGSDS